jgi:2-polyprenyl-3-methyl-5-hydroxy-6-metoxy-1,4-benzoquinol methylase
MQEAPGIQQTAAGQDASSGALTDKGFWDNQWSARGMSSRIAQFLRAGDHGADGLFIRLFKTAAGADLAGKSVVELGGASSRFLIGLARQGMAVTALDYSPIGLQQTRELFAREGIDGRVIEADLFSPELDLGRYDFVTHWGLVEHFEDPGQVMRVSARMVNADGLLVFTMPNMAAVGVGLWKFFAPQNFRAHIMHSDSALVTAGSEAGLELVRTFHTGPPLLRMAPCERFKPLSIPIDAAHAGFLLFARLFPGLFLRGDRRLANTRGFVFRQVRSH